ncbi:uncharacterized protein BDV14DRAFT_97187 [Aspergillus stella-maris]|uniref:uncharacterized protein n=1 Tax=Aspergillus stella-maris TaxID=1810926 RepID=UPI003CCDA4E0
MSTYLNHIGLADWSDIEPLFDKAINSPADITPEEKHRIAQWPPRETMEARCQEHLNCSVDDLMQRAAADKETLSYAEARMIWEGFNMLKLTEASERAMSNAQRIWTQKDLWEKHQQALPNVLSVSEIQAHKGVNAPRWITTSSDKPGWPKRTSLANRPPEEWIQKIIDQGDDRSWGYAIYCSGMDEGEEWREFRHNFEDWVRSQPVSARGSEHMRTAKVIDMINFDGPEGDLGLLRQKFRTLREEGGLRSGLLPHLFLYVTPEVRDSWKGPSFPWIWVVDPDWALDGPDEDGYDGRVPVNWAICYTKFYNFMSLERFSLKAIWQDWHGMREEREEPQPGWLLTKLDRPKWPFT